MSNIAYRSVPDVCSGGGDLMEAGAALALLCGHGDPWLHLLCPPPPLHTLGLTQETSPWADIVIFDDICVLLDWDVSILLPEIVSKLFC